MKKNPKRASARKPHAPKNALPEYVPMVNRCIRFPKTLWESIGEKCGPGKDWTSPSEFLRDTALTALQEIATARVRREKQLPGAKEGHGGSRRHALMPRKRSAKR